MTSLCPLNFFSAGKVLLSSGGTFLLPRCHLYGGVTKLNSWEDTNYQLVLAGVTISLIPSFILFVIMRRNMAKGGTEGSLVG